MTRRKHLYENQAYLLISPAKPLCSCFRVQHFSHASDEDHEDAAEAVGGGIYSRASELELV